MPKEKPKIHKFLKTKAWIVTHHNVGQSLLNEFIANNPDILELVDGQVYVNTGKSAYRGWRTALEAGVLLTPDNKLKPLKGGKQETNIDDFMTEQDKLQQKAIKAQHELDIYKAEQKKIQVEKEKIELDRTRMDLISHEHARYYYFSYLKKINLEIMRLDERFEKYLEDRLKQMLDPDVLHTLIKEFKDYYSRMIQSTIEDIKSQQQKEVESWE